jgi:hypothetical protein
MGAGVPIGGTDGLEAGSSPDVHPAITGASKAAVGATAWGGAGRGAAGSSGAAARATSAG